MIDEPQDFHIKTSSEPITEFSSQTPIDPNQDTFQAPSRKSKNILKGALLGLGVAIIIGIVAWSYIIVRKNLTDDISLNFARVVHLPAGFVNRKNIEYSDYVDDTKAVQN